MNCIKATLPIVKDLSWEFLGVSFALFSLGAAACLVSMFANRWKSTPEAFSKNL